MFVLGIYGFCLCCIPLRSGVPTLAEDSPARIQAAFIYNFLSFVEWPQASRDEPDWVLVILGDNPFEGAFDSIIGQRVEGRLFQVQHIPNPADFDPAQPCDMLYIHPDLKGETEDILFAMEGRPVLTISSYRGFAEAGGMINFRDWKNRVRFEINKGKARDAGLVIRSRLQRLALRVINRKGGSP